jgi:hypothetical protein
MDGNARSGLSSPSWRRDHQLWIELFVTANFAGLVLDIFLAHSENHFRRDSEYVPLFFSAAAAASLAIVLALRSRWPSVWRDIGHLVGWMAVLVGLAGVILHLDSSFFEDRTIRSLTYAAPFAAPLAFTGLGLLLIVNRLVAVDSIEWAQWVLLLGLGGFAGNFVFSLTDHAQNAFFNPLEWVPVVSSAFAIGFLIVPLVIRVTARYLWVCVAILGVQACVGVLGFGLHVWADLRRPAPTFFERILNGTPPMAPLLFPNLVLLALIALWTLAPHVRNSDVLS